MLDISSSMGGGRFRRAVAELLRSLDRLSPDQSFYLVLFSSNMRRMFDETEPNPMMLAATPENKRRLRTWIKSVEPGGSTAPREAIRFAMSLRPHAMFLLSDGAFDSAVNGKKGNLFDDNSAAGQIVGQDEVSPIHSFAYEDMQASANMRSLAALTGGQYRYLPPPGTNKTRQTAAARPNSTGQIAALAEQPPSPPLPPRQQAAALLRAADNLRDAGDVRKAVEEYRKIIRQYPLTSAGVSASGRVMQIMEKMRANGLRWGGPS